MSAHGKAVCSKVLFRKRASHDITSSTHDRGYAGEESLTADPSHLRAAGLAVCTPFQQVTGVTGTCGHPLLPGLSEERKEARSKFYYHRRSGSTLPLQNHTP